MSQKKYSIKKEFIWFLLALMVFNIILLWPVFSFAQSKPKGNSMTVANVDPSHPSIIGEAGEKNLDTHELASSPEKNGQNNMPLAPPANDDCAGAITLTPGNICSPYATTSNTATQSIAAINCGGFTGTANDDVWFKFTPTGTEYTIMVEGAANMDAVIDLREGPGCNGVNRACADATLGGGIEVINYNAFIPGTTYYIRVYDYATGGLGWGDFSICIIDKANNACSDGLNPPFILSPNVSCTNGNLAVGTIETGESFSCLTPTPTRSAWYAFQATQTDMWVSVRPTGATVCSANFGLTAYRYTGACPPSMVAGCKNFQTFSAAYVYNNLEMTGLSVGAWYLIQVTQNPGCARYSFCIKVGTYLNCSSCGSSCGPMCTFAGYSPPGPTPGTVVASCPGYPLGPPMNQFDTETHCYTFTAPNDSVYIQQVVWSYCNPQTYTFTYSLYTAGCGLIQSGSVFSNNLITGLVPGTLYKMCYTLQAACSWDSLIYPYMYTTASVLPVELVSFEAESHKKSILVKWSSASELNNKEYVLERTRDAVHFTEVARIKGAGNSTTLTRYEVPDRQPHEGINFYRLRQIDFDGTEHTTKLVSARFNKAGPSISVAPNPATERCLVNYFAEKNSLVDLKIYDLKGKVVTSRTLSHDEASYYSVDLDLSGLVQGIYYLKMVSNEEATTVKLIKE